MFQNTGSRRHRMSTALGASFKETGERLAAALRITRPHLSSLSGAYVFLGAYLGSEDMHFTASIAKSALVAILVVAFGFTLNDCVDVKADQINNAARPLPSGRLSLRFAQGLAATLVLAAVCIASTLEPQMFVLSAINVILTAAYSLYLKDMAILGNLCMAFLISTLFVFGGLSVGQLNRRIYLAAVLAFLLQCAQEVLWSIKGMAGDAAAGVNTTALRFGRDQALVIFHVLFTLTSVVSLAACAAGFVPARFGWAAIPILIIPNITALVIQSRSWPAERKLNLIITIQKFIRFAGIFVIIRLK